MESIIMLFTHVLKILDYIATEGLPAVPLEQLPGAVLEWAQYFAKLISIYIAVFLGNI